MDAVTVLLDAIERGEMESVVDVFAPDAVFDATVPNWRFSVTGARAIADQLASRFAQPGAFEQVRRTPLEDGELVEFFLTWHKHGVPHAAHQVHILKVAGQQIVEHVMFCGGQWSAARLAEMEAAPPGTVTPP